MKYVLVLLVLVIAVGVWRNRRRAEDQPRRERAAPRVGKPQDMVECAHCGLHLPRSEALQAGALSYCSAEHRSQAR
ncbi:PP0621 family protein [Comamonas composti]|uniref:PP0621 family protein n=1 Tax=Comamonas composti TaxID=408558 RepID=UPI0003F5C555|nr:PP0621 family protein [Comamonas composti]